MAESIPKIFTKSISIESETDSVELVVPDSRTLLIDSDIISGNILQLNTLSGTNAVFTSITGSVVSGTNASFRNITGSIISGTNVYANIGHFQLGSVSSPSIKRTDDTNTGIFFPSTTNTLAITNNGAQRVYVDTSGVQITGNIRVSDGFLSSPGNASFPSYTFEGDENTGIYSPGADTIAFVEGGAEIMRIDSSSRIGIGKTATNDKLEINGNVTVTGTLRTSADLQVNGGDLTSNVATFNILNTNVSTINFGGDADTFNLATNNSSGPSTLSMYGNGTNQIRILNSTASAVVGTDIGSINMLAPSSSVDGSGLSTKGGMRVRWDSTTNSGRIGFVVGLANSNTVATIMTVNTGGVSIGIGSASPQFNNNLYVQESGSGVYIARFNNTHSLGNGILVQAGTGSATRTLVDFRDINDLSIGSITYLANTVTYGAFTGEHPGYILNNIENYEYGTIVKIINSISNDRSIIYNVSKTSSSYDKTVLGIFAGQNSLNSNQNSLMHGSYSIYSVGDGHILVCNQGGDIEIGDYLCSSETSGVAMKQNDDLMHSYTIAKATQNIRWIEQTNDIVLISCTYHAA